METHTQQLPWQTLIRQCRDSNKSIINIFLFILLAALNTSDTKAQIASRQNNGSANFLAFNTSFNNSSSLKDENPWKTIQQGVATIDGNQVHYSLEAGPLANPAANLDQEANGKTQFTATTGSGTDWVNGNLNGSKSHYLEGYSIPYRMIVTGLTIGRTYIQKISWDITEAPGKHALDYITHYQNLDNPAGSHLVNFGHAPEVINPAFGIAGLSAPATFPIDAPSSAGSPIAGQPTTSFNTLNKKNFTIYSGTITDFAYDTEESLTGDHSISAASITFVASGTTVVLAWGGHIAAQADWTFGHSASATNGSPYHMRNVNLCVPNNATIPTPANSTYTCSGGNQDRSLQTNAVIVPPDCNITGPTSGCPGQSLCFDATINAAGQTTTYAWTFAANTAGASFSSGATSGSLAVGVTAVPQICVTTTTIGSYTLNLHITRVTDVGTLTHDCQYVVNVAGISITGDIIATEADDDADGIKPLTGTADCPKLYEMNLLKTNVAHLTASGAATTYAWAFSPNTGANVTFVDNGDGTASFTVNSTLALASEYKFIVTGTNANGCVAKDSLCIRPTSVLPLCNLCGPVIICSGAGDKVYSLKDNCANANPDALDLDDFTYTWSITNVIGGGSVAFVGAFVDVATVTTHITGTVTSYTVQLNINGKGPLHINVPPCTITTTVGSISASAVATDALCFGGNGSVDLTVTGGSAPFTYAWSNGATTEDLASVPAGPYSVTVTDANGCTATANATVGAPPDLTASAIATDASCSSSNGSVDLTVGGGTPPYTYIWSNGATTEDLASVPPGPYSVTVTDANGCTETANATVGAPGGIIANAVATDALCSGGNGSVDLTVSGGTPPYTFAWSNGATTEDLASVPAGPYSVTVTDAHGCTQTAGATVGAPPDLTASAIATDASCSSSNGSVDLTVGGGTAPYTYLWSNGATTEDLASVPAGPYSVTVTDAHGCTETAGATVGAPGGIIANAIATDALCSGGNGSVDLTVSSGTGPYTFLWSNGATTEDLASVPAGSYSVTVTDANGCTQTAGATVNAPPDLTASPTGFNALCLDGNGSVDLNVSGGTGPYSFLWSNGATTQNLASVLIGSISLTLSVTVTDFNGCAKTASVTLTAPSRLSCSLTAPSTIGNCSTTGNTVSGSASGGTGPYTCSASFDATGTGAGWSVTDCSVSAGGAITVTYNAGGAATTVLTVIVTDANGCQSTCTVTLTCNGGKSCTPGFWKNHPDVWDSQNDFTVNNMPGSLPSTPGGTFVTTTNFWTYFGLPIPSPGSNNGISNKAGLTMLDATALGGGDCKALARHGVSALLAAAAFPAEYPFPAGTSDFFSLYTLIANTLASGDCSSLATILGNINDLDGPFCSALSQLPQVDARLVTSTQLTVKDVYVNASPNPYNSVIHFNLVSPESGQASLEIYDMVGRKLAVVYTGKMQANIARTVTYQVSSIQKRIPIVYKFTVGTKTVVGKMLPAAEGNINYTP